MFSQLFSLTRSGMVALIAFSVLPAEAPAAPVGPVMPAIADGSLMKPIEVRGEGRDRSSSPGAYHPWVRRHAGPRGVYRNRAFHNVRPDYRRHYRHGPRRYWGPGIVLNFGIPAYRYSYAPYRARYAGSAHVEWCYTHYRSYRVSDNTYKPYGAPRRQCISPYYR